MQKSIIDVTNFLSESNYEIPLSASGLDFYEEGELIKGTLNKAELKGQILFWIGITIGIVLFIWTEIKVFKRKKQTRVL